MAVQGGLQSMRNMAGTRAKGGVDDDETPEDRGYDSTRRRLSLDARGKAADRQLTDCLLYTSPSPRD